MLDWIRDNYAFLSVLAIFGALAVWAAYLQVFMSGYRRNTRPQIVISQTGDALLDSRCLVSNMSSEPIFIESIFVSLDVEGERWDGPVTEVRIRPQEEDRSSDPRLITHKGPLKPGEYTDIGSFGDLLQRILVRNEASENYRRFLNEPAVAGIRVIADYASEYLLIGAERKFDLFSRDGEWLLRAQSVKTTQIRGTRQRKDIERTLRERH